VREAAESRGSQIIRKQGREQGANRKDAKARRRSGHVGFRDSMISVRHELSGLRLRFPVCGKVWAAEAGVASCPETGWRSL
jgi:hypothetical protein